MERGVRAAVAARLDVSGAPEAKPIGFSANPQVAINFALDLALFLKLFLQDCSQVLLFERLFACMACRGQEFESPRLHWILTKWIIPIGTKPGTKLCW